MFQRLRNAYDQVLEEQNRQRPLQQSPSKRATPSERAGQTASPARRSSQRPAHRAKENAQDLSGPDPNPATFEPEKIADDESGHETTTSTAPETDEMEARTGVTAPDDSAREMRSLENEKPQTEEESEKDVVPEPELPSDVQSKLRKLNKLEEKYKDLLQAYRKAHARNSLIEPFEAKLREVTPLTSISEPTAFVEYLNQVQQRGDIVMQEFRKTSAEKDELKKKLEDAERRLTEAWDKVGQFEEQPSKSSDLGQISNGNDINESQGKNGSSEDQVKEEQSEDMFSYDDEVPRLQSELEERDRRINDLQDEKHNLQRDLESARESAEHMMRDLELKQAEIENLKTTTQSSEQAKEETDTKVRNLDAEISSLRSKISSSEEEMSSLNQRLTIAHTDIKQKETEISKQKEKHVESEKEVEKLRAAITKPSEDSKPNGISHATISPNGATPEAGAGQGSKKNKKKKKKGGGANSTSTDLKPSVPSQQSSEARNVDSERKEVDDIQQRLEDSLRQLQEKNAELERLNEKLQSHDEMKDEVETLREQLLNVGQDHVEAKERIKSLEADRKTLQDELAVYKISDIPATSEEQEKHAEELGDLRSQHSLVLTERDGLLEKIRQLETEIVNQTANQSSSKKDAESQRTALSDELGKFKSRAENLQSELTAAQQLSSSRFKEITNLQHNLQKLRPELTSLRSEVSELKGTRDDLSAKAAEVRSLESRESRLKNESEVLKQQILTKDTEVKRLNEKANSESSRRSNLEETNRKLERDLQRSRNERNEAASSRESYVKKFNDADSELQKLRVRVQELESEVEKLNSDTSGLREEIALKTAQHASAQSLMNSLRDQSSEMATQLKESKERAESLEEELTDAHRLMNERGREGETMRRILADIEARTDSRVKEMREQMEVAMQERDRAEDEASAIGRRRGRELDDTKNKLREVERDLRRANEQKSDIERIEKDLRQRNAEDAEKFERATTEVTEVRKAMSELRDALDESERQSRELDVERGSTQRSLEQANSQLEKLQKSSKTMSEELKSLRAPRVRATDSGAQSSRSSTDSSNIAATARVTSPGGNNREDTRRGSANAPNVDYVYLKNVLLQFLEQKDQKYKMQLIPVLGMLLHFDKKDEQKWMSAVSAH